jgi:hypothetical protein
MSAQDRAIIFSTTDAQVHGRPPGTTAKWSKPNSGHSGTVTLLSKSTRRGMACERIEYRILEPRSTRQHGRYVFTRCKLPDGSWKFLDKGWLITRETCLTREPCPAYGAARARRPGPRLGS